MRIFQRAHEVFVPTTMKGWELHETIKFYKIIGIWPIVFRSF